MTKRKDERIPPSAAQSEVIEDEVEGEVALPLDYIEEAETALKHPDPEPPKGFAFERAFKNFSVSVRDVRRRQEEADALRLSPEDLREVVDLFHLLNEWYEEKLR